MKTFASFLSGAVVFGALVSTALADIERVVSRKFDVGPGGLLSIDTYSGSIRVEPSSAANTVTVEVRQKIVADSEAEADELLQKLSLAIEQRGAEIAAHARYEGPRSVGWFWQRPAVRVEFVVSVPSRFDVNLKTAGGNITVGDLAGNVRVRTSGGSLNFGRIEGNTDGETSGGSIRLASCAGDTRLRTSGGSLKLGRLAGAADVRTSGGSIAIDEVAGGALQAHTSGGSVEVSFAGRLTGDSSVTSSGGSITVAVDPKSAFRLDASTSGGSVKTNLPITLPNGNASTHKISGEVNGGGPLLKVHTSGGSVRVNGA